jgi:hypothetical protein
MQQCVADQRRGHTLSVTVDTPAPDSPSGRKRVARASVPTVVPAHFRWSGDWHGLGEDGTLGKSPMGLTDAATAAVTGPIRRGLG